MKLVAFIGLMALLGGGLAGWAAPERYQGLALFGGTMLVLWALPKLLMAHMNRIASLRYLRGNVQQALLEWGFWRPLLEREQYLLLRAGMLVQAELYGSVESMLEDSSVQGPARGNALFTLHRNREEWDLALGALDQFLPSAEGIMKSALLVERACLLADHFPDRLAQALEDFREALKYPTAADNVMLGLEGMLLTLAGQAEMGLSILQKFLPLLEKQSQTSLDILPALANHRRQLGRALWALDRPAEATEMLLKARDTYTSTRWKRLLDKDLANLREHGRLFPVPSEVGQQAAQDYLEGYQTREQWPGNAQSTSG